MVANITVSSIWKCQKVVLVGFPKNMGLIWRKYIPDNMLRNLSEHPLLTSKLKRCHLAATYLMKVAKPRLNHPRPNNLIIGHDFQENKRELELVVIDNYEKMTGLRMIYYRFHTTISVNSRVPSAKNPAAWQIAGRSSLAMRMMRQVIWIKEQTMRWFKPSTWTIWTSWPPSPMPAH